MDSPLKVLVVTTSFPLTTESSSGIFIQRLIKHYPKDVSVTVLVPDGNETIDIKHLNKLYNYTIKTFSYAPKKFQLLTHKGGGIPAALKNSPWLYFLVPGLICSMFFSCLVLSRKSDVIHANWSITGMLAGLAGLLSNRPTMTTIRGEDISRAEKYTVDKLIMRLCIKLNKHVICVNNDITTRITKLFNKKNNNLIYIPNGVDSNLLDIKRNYKTDVTFKLLTVGSLISRKSIHTAINAVAICKNCQLIIIGDGPEKNKLHSLAEKMALSEKVIFKGHVSPDSIINEYKCADAFVFTSLSEGRPNVVLEAMATGLPIIASRIKAIEEIINHKNNGILFDTENYEELASCIDLLKNDHDLRSTLGHNSRNYIKDNNFTWNNSARSYIDLYKNMTRKTNVTGN